MGHFVKSDIKKRIISDNLYSNYNKKYLIFDFFCGIITLYLYI